MADATDEAAIRAKVAQEIESVADALDYLSTDEYAGLIYAADIVLRGADRWLRPEWGLRSS